MDTILNSKTDRMLLSSLTTASNVSMTPDDPIVIRPTEISVEINQSDRAIRAASVCCSTSVVPDEKAPQPSPPEVCTSQEGSQSVMSSRKLESLKSTTADTEPDNEDLCAAILLACLFCQPLDCLLATFRGCNSWIWSLCTSVCGCKCSTLQPLLDVTQHCDLCECVDAHCCLCDWTVCDLCHQTTECLDFAMEISQMLYH